MAKPAEEAVQAWVALIRAATAGLGQVEKALKAANLPPLAWYDVLWELERAGPLRPRQLQARLLLAQYNLSRLLERMVAAGLVERAPCAEDRRGQLLAATVAGRETRARMWPVYAAAIEAAVGARLSADEARRLTGLLGRLGRPGSRANDQV